MIKPICFVLTLLHAGSGFAQSKSINLAGNWEVYLDLKNELVLQHRNDCKTSGTIKLPGSLAENGFGWKTTGSDYGILTPEFKYVGNAWYKRQIEIPENWEGNQIEIFLERVLWQSQVFIDGKLLSIQDALGTPHIHQLGKIAAGKHELIVLIDNNMIHNIGDKGHAYGEYTQSIWNGIIGRMEMRAKAETRFRHIDVFSDIQNEQINLKLAIYAKNSGSARVGYKVFEEATQQTVLQGSFLVDVKEGVNNIEKQISTDAKLGKWSEFTPVVYILKSTLKTDTSVDTTETEFGFCQMSHNGTKMLVNGRPVFLRGNLDCVHFPLTGYPSCNVDDWVRIFKMYKTYGLNHARFHSWCPPEAAFKAANRVGIYLQAEASIWIDWWMSADMIKEGHPEMDTKGHPKGLGYDPPRDSFVVAEMNRMVHYYGNNPSFALFCIGNELGNSDFSVMKKWVADLKKKDPRRLYAVSTARKITEVDDFSATHYVKDVGRTRGLNGARTNWNFEEVYSKMNIPIIAHEIGQWPVYPRWSEIEKYTGVLKARNLEGFKIQAEKNGIANQNEDFVQASGALNQLMYKYETESFLRTPSCAGVQLLSMQDYQGQGEALIGWLDCFWESKNITTPEKFRQHFNTTVPLLLTEKFVWENNKDFIAKVQVSHHGENDLVAAVSWKIINEKGEDFVSGKFPEKRFDVGSLTNVGEIKVPLSAIDKAQKLIVSTQIEGTSFYNEWPVWVYPAAVPIIQNKNVLVVDKLGDKTLQKLENGAKVLFAANNSGTDKTSVKALFYPLYWSLTFFPGQGKTNIGLLLNDKHPAFASFPTSFHSNWQWETISSDAKGFILNDFPHSFRPIAQPVDDFHRNNKIGSIFELKVGKGKLLVCGYNINSEKPVARQLKFSLLKYMNSAEFNPKLAVEKGWLSKTFETLPVAGKADVPKEFTNAIFLVDAADKLKAENESVSWSAALDEIEIAKDVSYQLMADGVWREGAKTAWHGNQIQLQIDCPAGMLGTLLVHFTDWNNTGRTGIIEFEGRKSKLGLHRGNGVWIKFHVMREDSNDRKLVLKTSTQTGPNLMISKVVLLKE